MGVYQLGGYSPELACIVTDAEDSPGAPISVAPVVDDDRDGLGLGQVSASCTYTDAGGLTDPDEVTFNVVDTVAPTMQRLSLLPAPNAAGWNDSPVTATWGCFDAGSDVVAMEVSKTTTGEGTDLELTGTCEDQAGNTTSDTIDGLDVDLTEPVITIGRSPAADDCRLEQRRRDRRLDLRRRPLGRHRPRRLRVLGEGADQSATGTCTDQAGNTASAGVTGVEVDKTPPVIKLESRTAPYDDRGWNTGTSPSAGPAPTAAAARAVEHLPGRQHSRCRPDHRRHVHRPGGQHRQRHGRRHQHRHHGSVDRPVPRSADANANGWNDSPVGVTWTCTDTGGAGVVKEGGSHVVDEGAGQSVRRTCTDHAGNTATGEVDRHQRRPHQPDISLARALPQQRTVEQHRRHVAWTCTDALPGSPPPATR